MKRFYSTARSCLNRFVPITLLNQSVNQGVNPTAISESDMLQLIQLEDCSIKKYSLNHKGNIYHVSEWELTNDFEKICSLNNMNGVIHFHNRIIKNYPDFLKNESNGTMTFRDYIWGQNININFDVYQKFMNCVFRDLVVNNKINEELIRWFDSLGVIQNETYYYTFNTLCHTGDLKNAKLIHEICPIDFNYEHLDCFRTVLSRNKLEMAKWLYEIGAVVKDPKEIPNTIQNIVMIAKRDSNSETLEWLKGLKEFSAEFAQ
jgi:hypothetical protein